MKVRGWMPFGLTRLAGILQLVRSVILVISKGFVDFNSGVLPRGWCGRRRRGGGAIGGWVRVVRGISTEADQASSSYPHRVPIDGEREGLVLDLARWDLHDHEDRFHDGRGGQSL